jgi:uncharacterized iron-regulated protein
MAWRKTGLAAAALAAATALVLTALPGASKVPDDAPVLRVADGKTISFARMASELVSARAVFLGELHHLPDHHRIQLSVIQALHEASHPIALGLEMFRAEDQDGLDAWTAGRMDERSFRRLYERNWTLPWELYADIFRYARDHGIPLVGLNVPESVTSKVARRGFSSLSETEARKLPPGVACEVDDAYMEFIRRSHGLPGHGGRSFRFFCEAQMVWDSAMARHLADYLARHPERSVTVLAGSGHAWRRGVPARLQQLAPGLRSLVVLPRIDGKIAHDTVTTADADYVVL